MLGSLAIFVAVGLATLPARAEPVSSAAAQAGAMCREHGVLEAVCTKCNPALIPVFRAKGDWCEAHGFPESFCPICRPDRGGQPAADVSADGAPADGTRVRFKTKDAARQAGLQVEQAAERPMRSELNVTGRIVYDATRIAELNARSPGVIRAVLADTGTRVEVGTPLAEIDSAGAGADRSRLQAARSRARVAEAAHNRLKTLSGEGIAPEKDVLAARQELDAARADVSAAENAVDMFGPAGAQARYTLASPIAGVVTRRTATIGRLVDTEPVLFEIVDTSAMRAELDIPEPDAARAAAGQPVRLTIDGLGDREFSGTLDLLAPEVDPHTRTVKARLSLPNPDGALRANLLVRARIAVADGRRIVAVPNAALQRAGATHFVFVRLAQDLFETRRVRPGDGDGTFTAVDGRVAPGDEVVTEGSFLLKTETLKDSIGAGCCDVEEPR